MIGEHGITPPALLHNLKHNRVLHDRVIFLTVESETVPVVPEVERVAVRAIGEGIHEMTLRFGYMESPDVPAVLGDLAIDGTTLSRTEVTYFLARETVVRQLAPGGMGWTRPIFALMNRNARPASSFFHLPPNRVVELGAQVEL
jgi:KUP system potassium uptake protein